MRQSVFRQGLVEVLDKIIVLESLFQEGANHKLTMVFGPLLIILSLLYVIIYTCYILKI